jgi:hypothetical protein
MINKFLSKFIVIIPILLLIAINFFCVSIAKAGEVESGVNVLETVSNQTANISNTKVYDVTVSDVKITWETDVAAMCTFYYGTDLNYSQSRAESDFINHHFFNITELAADTIYHFKISCKSQHDLLTETDDQTFETSSPSASIIQAVAGIIEALKNFGASVAENPIAKASEVPVNAAAVTVVFFSIFLPEILNLPFLSLWDKFSLWIIPLAGIFKKGRKWGIVYDSESGKPLPLAKVTVYDSNKKPIETVLTDNQGRYGFVVDPGKYYLAVMKKNYSFPSKIVDTDYHLAPIEVSDNGLVAANIPIDPDLHKLIKNMGSVTRLTEFLDKVKTPLLVLGIVLSTIFFIHNPTLMNILTLLIYVVIVGYELHLLFQPHASGNVYDIMGNKPVESSVIRIYNEKTGQLVATKMSDEHGRYYYLVDPGEYQIKTTKENFEQSEIKDIHFKQGDVLTKDIYLKKIAHA